MALSAPAIDTIDGSGFPLCFKTEQGSESSPVLGLRDSRDTFVVQARAMGGHQKEAVVTEGKAGPSWRMVSDEGAGLQGTDLAPFPLGFMSAGLQADLISRIRQRAVRQWRWVIAVRQVSSGGRGQHHNDAMTRGPCG